MQTKEGYYVETHGTKRDIYRLQGEVRPHKIGREIIEYIEGKKEGQEVQIDLRLRIEHEYIGFTKNPKYPKNSYVYENKEGVLTIYERGRILYVITPGKYHQYKEYLQDEWDVRMTMCIDRVSGEARYKRLPEICKIVECGELEYVNTGTDTKYYIEKTYDKYDEVYTIRDKKEDSVCLKFIWVNNMRKYVLQLPYGRRVVEGVEYSGIREYNRKLIGQEECIEEHRASIRGYQQFAQTGEIGGVGGVTEEIYKGYNEEYKSEIDLITIRGIVV